MRYARPGDSSGAALLPVAAVAGGGDRRVLIGIQVTTGCRRVAAVLLAARDTGLDAQCELVDGTQAAVPPELTERFDRLWCGQPAGQGEVALLARGLAEVQAELIRQLLRQAALTPDQIYAVGVCDPGLWHVAAGDPTSYMGLCDAARLAEATGLCVIDAFPARDLAAGGQGGPLTAFPLWMLFRRPDASGALLDLGRTVRLTYLPASADGRGADRLLAFDVGPGTRLLDTLAVQFSRGQMAYDPGGRLAVQGRRIPDLIEHWLEDPYFQKPLPRWYPLGVQPDDELKKTVQMAVDSGWSLRDLLCTATHFIAECVCRALNERLPEQPPLDHLWITGGGRQNGMLLGEIAARDHKHSARITSELGVGGDQLDAACAAVLALLHVDQVAANHPAITGSDRPRILGRLSPGSPHAWRQLLQHIHEATPAATSLRNAV